VICVHVEHVLRDLAGLLRELRRLLKAGGKLCLASAVQVNTWRDGHLRASVCRGIMPPPRRAQEIRTALRNMTRLVSGLSGQFPFRTSGPRHMSDIAVIRPEHPKRWRFETLFCS
jgi:SAM-dependent methyltransferase